MMKTFFAFVAARVAVIVASPGVALACPQGAGREDGGWQQTVMRGLFVNLPFAIVGVVYRFIRSESQGRVARAPSRLRT